MKERSDGEQNSAEQKQLPRLKLVGNPQIKTEAWGWGWRSNAETRPTGERVWEVVVKRLFSTARFWNPAGACRWGGGHLYLRDSGEWKRWEPGMGWGVQLTDGEDGSKWSWTGKWTEPVPNDHQLHVWSVPPTSGWAV